MKSFVKKITAKSIGSYINLLSYTFPNKSLALAYQFFSQPRKGKLIENELPKSLLETQRERFNLNEHTFQTYTWQGNNDIILLVHGWESNTSRWEKLLPYLKKTGKTIISIDAPAHGLSSGKEFNVPLYSTFIDVVVQKYNPKIVIGHSIGGNAIAHFQAHYKHSFQKMVLLGAPSDFSVILQNYITLLGLNNKVHQQLIDYTKTRFNTIVDEFSAAKYLANTTVPGIIAHDIQDDVVLYEEAKKISSNWKTAQFITTNGLGHSMHNEDLYNTIIKFIED